MRRNRREIKVDKNDRPAKKRASAMGHAARAAQPVRKRREPERDDLRLRTLSELADSVSRQLRARERREAETTSRRMTTSLAPRAILEPGPSPFVRRSPPSAQRLPRAARLDLREGLRPLPEKAVCKERPDPSKGGGGGAPRKFVPWCKMRR